MYLTKSLPNQFENETLFWYHSLTSQKEIVPRSDDDNLVVVLGTLIINIFLIVLTKASFLGTNSEWVKSDGEQAQEDSAHLRAAWNRMAWVAEQ